MNLRTIKNDSRNCKTRWGRTHDPSQSENNRLTFRSRTCNSHCLQRSWNTSQLIAIKKFDSDASPIQVAGVKLTAKQPVAIVTKRLTAWWKYRAMFIKPPKLARLTAPWSKMPALFAVPRPDLHNNSRTSTPTGMRQRFAPIWKITLIEKSPIHICKRWRILLA